MTAQKLDFSMLCDERIEALKVRIYDESGFRWVRLDGGAFCSCPINLLDLDQTILILSQVRDAAQKSGAYAETT